MRKALSLVLLLLCGVISKSFAQISLKKIGTLSGSIESNSQYYNKVDDKLGFIAPDDRFRSNNYLKLNYGLKRFSVGMQYEIYEQAPILGFPENLKGDGITNYFVAYTAKKYSLTVGHFYEQLGSGAVLRAWEDRQLGINNALFGGRLTFTPNNNFSFKAVYGKKRDAYTTGEGSLLGADAELNISKWFTKDSSTIITTGFSFVNKTEDYTGTIANFPKQVNLYSCRLSYAKQRFSMNAEYAFRTNDGLINDLGNVINSTHFYKGDLLSITTNFSGKNSATNISLRKVQNFAMKTDRKAPLNQLLLNYIPALTKQQHYSLANIYVYNAQSKFSFLPGNLLNSAGEIGGQIEWFKNFPKNTKLGGKYGTQLNINSSNYYALAFDGVDVNTTKVYSFKTGKNNFRDINIELKKNLSKKTKANFSYIRQWYNQNTVEGYGSENLTTHILIAEGIFKFKKARSLKADIQHMWVKEGKGDWAAITTEYNFSPKFNLFFADLYNYGNEYKKVHYYSTGATFTKSAFRIMASYGRQREGLLCVGGVCRLVPASTGFSLSASYAF